MGKHLRLYYPACAGFVVGPGKKEGIDQGPTLAADNNKEITNMAPKATPYIHHNGEIIIPFNSDPKYHFWNGGQHICDTLVELNAPQDFWDKHTLKPYPVSEV